MRKMKLFSIKNLFKSHKEEQIEEQEIIENEIDEPISKITEFKIGDWFFTELNMDIPDKVNRICDMDETYYYSDQCSYGEYSRSYEGFRKATESEISDCLLSAIIKRGYDNFEPICETTLPNGYDMISDTYVYKDKVVYQDGEWAISDKIYDVPDNIHIKFIKESQLFAIGFNNNKSMINYDPMSDTYFITPTMRMIDDDIKCCLIECEKDDINNGDIFMIFTNIKYTPDTSRSGYSSPQKNSSYLETYRIKTKDDSCIIIGNRNVSSDCDMDHNYSYEAMSYYKLILK